MADIFISYAREDTALAGRLAHALERLGWSVWWDRAIPAGRTFDDVIDEELAAARCVIVMWSSNSVSSPYVRGEAMEAAERHVLVPVLTAPDIRIPRALRAIHAADLIGWSGADDTNQFTRLIDDIGRLLGPPPAAVAVREPAAVRGPMASRERQLPTESAPAPHSAPIRNASLLRNASFRLALAASAVFSVFAFAILFPGSWKGYWNGGTQGGVLPDSVSLEDETPDTLEGPTLPAGTIGSPAGAALNSTAVRNPARDQLLGEHLLALQWISWDYFGRLVVTDSAGVLIARGEQRSRENDDYLEVDGIITSVDARQFTFSGSVTTKVYHLNGGRPCTRQGEMTFRITGTRQYWRLAQMDNPCDAVTDYVDIFF